jgi:hypothetical protein
VTSVVLPYYANLVDSVLWHVSDSESPTDTTGASRKMILSEAWRALLLVLCLGWLPSSTALADDVLIPVTRFDSKGQLPQSNAAAQAVERGGAVVAIVGRSEILFVAPRCVWLLNTVACVRCVSRLLQVSGAATSFHDKHRSPGTFPWVLI